MEDLRSTILSSRDHRRCRCGRRSCQSIFRKVFGENQLTEECRWRCELRVADSRRSFSADIARRISSISLLELLNSDACTTSRHASSNGRRLPI